MTSTSTKTAPIEIPDVAARPVGTPLPAHPRALRALHAITENRWSDAEENIAHLPDSPLIERAWKRHLDGLVRMHLKDFAGAESAFLQCAVLSLVETLPAASGPSESKPVSLRLAAWAMDQAGVIFRRRELAADALAIHKSSYRIRCDHGSWEEVFETATNLALDADVARLFEEALKWHQLAIDAAERATENSLTKQAAAWCHISGSYTSAGRLDAAVSAAKRGRDLWAKSEAGSAAAVKADLELGAAMLRHANAALDRRETSAPAMLKEALDLLVQTREALRAFGSVHAVDIRWCEDQIDFAERLRQSELSC